jgi:cytoskeleton protein RodZ
MPRPAPVETPKIETEPVAPKPVMTPAANTKAEPRKAPSDRTLKLRFKGESWVEIKDRSGRILLSRLNLPGSETEVSGRPPFNVVIGNAPDVQVLYEDREFPLEPHTKVAVARFTVE